MSKKTFSLVIRYGLDASEENTPIAEIKSLKDILDQDEIVTVYFENLNQIAVSTTAKKWSEIKKLLGEEMLKKFEIVENKLL